MPHPDHVAGQFPHSENHFVLSFVHLLPTEKQVSVRRIREVPSEQAKNSYDCSTDYLQILEKIPTDQYYCVLREVFYFLFFMFFFSS